MIISGPTEITPEISRVEIRLPMLLGNFLSLRVNVYVLETPDGLCLVDCGPADLYANLRALIAKSFPGKRIQRVYLTHGHADHAGAGGRCANDGIEIWAAEGDRQMLRDGGPDGVPKKFRYPGFEATRSLVQGDRIRLINGRELEVVPLPGHTDGSVGFEDADAQVLLCGDALYGPSRGYWTTFLAEIFTSRGQPPHELRAQADSLNALKRRLAERPRTRLLPGHGPPGPFDSGATSIDRSGRILRRVLMTKRDRSVGSRTEN